SPTVSSGTIAADGSLVLRLYYNQNPAPPVVPPTPPTPPTPPVVTPPTTPVEPPVTPAAPPPTEIQPPPPPTEQPPEVTGVWALVNLLLTIIGVLAALVLMVMYFVNRKKEEEKEEQDQLAKLYGKQIDESEVAETQKKRLWPRIVAAALSVVAIILFFVTQDLTLPMGMFDQWTVWHVIIFIVLAVFAAFGLVKVKPEKGKAETPELEEQPVPLQGG
ncbi:MAG: hypothetical protein FWF91_00675, partial [Coriobacteriia bacterium]|nr:hypothetical protein [Coriobacteriia bacterium]